MTKTSVKTIGDLIGGWGPYQWNIFIFDLTIQMSSMANILSMSFMAPKVDFYCSDYSSNLDHYSKPLPHYHSSNGNNNSHNKLTGLGSCFYTGIFNNETSKPCTSYQIDTSIFGTTLTSEYSLICDRNYLPSTSNALFVLGYLIASFWAGWAADRYGRKPVLWISTIAELIAGIACSFTFSMWFFMIFRLILGITVYAKFLTAYTMVMEVAGSKERTIYGPLTRMGRSVGTIVITIIAYYVNNFRQLHLIITLPGIFWLFWLTRIPESPRWLLIKGKIEEAGKVVKHIAGVNSIDLNEQGVDDLDEELKIMYQVIVSSSIKENENEDGESKLKNKSFIDLFKTPQMRINSIIMSFNWFVIVFVYYSLSLNVQDLGGNFYVNFIISGLVEFPSIILCIYALKIAGRRTILSVSCLALFLASALSIPFFIYEFNGSIPLRVSLVMFGKFIYIINNLISN